MQKTRRIASAVVGCGLALGALAGVAVAKQPALPASDKPAAILVWPKIVVDTNGVLDSSTGSTDTLIQLSSTVATRNSKSLDLAGMKQAHCFYVDATGHCSNNPSTGCLSSDDCFFGGVYGSCDPGWTEVDFNVRITPEQPLAWLASQGLHNGDLPIPVPGTCSNGKPCMTNDDCGGFTCTPQPSNVGTGVPPTPEDPFVGSLTCIQFNPLTNPPTPDTTATANALIGNASIEVALESTGGADVQKYNAVGIQKLCNFNSSGAVTDCSVNGPVTDTLQLGGTNPAYQSCPARLILNHLFDGAEDPLGATGEVTTDLTLIPCGNDFLRQIPGQVTAQFVVFNEFEQRFSTSANVDCFYESQISNIDTPNNSRSIFHYNVAGTLAGQTIINGVGSAATGQGLLGVARVFYDGENGAAYNLNEKGASSDIITIP